MTNLSKKLGLCKNMFNRYYETLYNPHIRIFKIPRVYKKTHMPEF